LNVNVTFPAFTLAGSTVKNCSVSDLSPAVTDTGEPATVEPTVTPPPGDVAFVLLPQPAINPPLNTTVAIAAIVRRMSFASLVVPQPTFRHRDDHPTGPKVHA
jgi:hypothetical protein